MATPGDLVTAVAQALALQVGTVRQYDRSLAEAGLRTSGGRGRSAPEVTSGDAARLFIASVAGAVFGFGTKDAAEAVRFFGGLRQNLPPKLQAKDYAALRLSVLAELPPHHEFERFLEAVIQSLRQGQLAPARGDWKEEKETWYVRLDFSTGRRRSVEAPIFVPHKLWRRMPSRGPTLGGSYSTPLGQRTGDDPEAAEKPGFLYVRASVGFASLRLLAAGLGPLSSGSP